MPAATLSRETRANAAEPAQLVKAVIQVAVDRIDVGDNVRKDIAGVDELAASIKEHGVLQPIKVRPAGDRWVIVWGQRRYLAAKQAGLTTIPAITSGDELSAVQLSTEQLVENLHRADLNPIDRAKAMRAVVDSGVRQVDLARKLGLAPSTVANDLRLLEAAPEVQEALESGSLSPAHSRAIQALDVDLQADFAERVRRDGWSAHETERQAKWVADQAKEIRARKAQAERRLVEAIAALEKVTSRDKATIGVADYGGATDLKGLLGKAGWNVVDGWSMTALAQAGSCGCAGAWRVEVPYNSGQKLTLRPGCIDKGHQEAERTRQHAESDAHWQREREKNEARARREQEEKARRRVPLLEFLTEHPTDPFAVRVTLAALVPNEFDELLAEYQGQGDDDTDAWTLLMAMPDEKIPALLGRAVVDALDDDYWMPKGLLEAIDARFPAPAAPADGEPKWYGLRRSPRGGYTPSHAFPADTGIDLKGRVNHVASCGFDPADHAKNGHFDMLIDAETSDLKAIKKPCAKCFAISVARNGEAPVTA